MTEILIIEHAPKRAEGLVAEAEKYGVGYHTWTPYLGENLERDIKSFNGVIVGGGPMGAYELDKFPFFKEELSFIEQLFLQGVPTFGVCLGAQIIAKMLGCDVRKTFWRRGFQCVTCVDQVNSDPLFDGVEGSFPVFQYHQDEITSLPNRSVLTLTSPDCRVEGFRLLDIPVWGIQAHPEIGLNKATAILQSVKGLDGDIDQMLQLSSDPRTSMNTKLFENFFSFCSK